MRPSNRSKLQEIPDIAAKSGIFWGRNSDIKRQQIHERALFHQFSATRHPAPILARLFRFLGVSDRNEVVEACLARTSFAALSGGRPAGVEQNGSFFRKGAVRDWGTTFTPEMTEMVLRGLGWMFPHFGREV
jgi:Sulfotransferase domain